MDPQAWMFMVRVNVHILGDFYQLINTGPDIVVYWYTWYTSQMAIGQYISVPMKKTHTIGGWGALGLDTRVKLFFGWL